MIDNEITTRNDTTMEFEVFEFIDNYQLTNLDAFLNQVGKCLPLT